LLHPIALSILKQVRRIGTALLLLVAAVLAAGNEPVLECPRVDHPPRVDGRLDEPEWARAAPLGIERRDQLHPDYSAAWTGPGDASALVRALRTATDLYLGFEVRDDVLLHEPGRPWWVGDSIEVFFDTDLVTEGDPVDRYTEDDVQLFLMPFHRGQRWGVLARSAGARYPDGGFRGVRVAFETREGGYTVECRIPLANFASLATDASGCIGFDVALNDVDRKEDERPESYLTLGGRFDLFARPGNFSRLRLGGAGAPPRAALAPERYLTGLELLGGLGAVALLAWAVRRVAKRFARRRRARTVLLCGVQVGVAGLLALTPTVVKWVDDHAARARFGRALAAAEAAVVGFVAVDAAPQGAGAAQAERLFALFRDGRVKVRPRYRFHLLHAGSPSLVPVPDPAAPGGVRLGIRVEPGEEQEFPLDGFAAPSLLRIDLAVVPPLYRERAAELSCEVELRFAEGEPFVLRVPRPPPPSTIVEIPAERVGGALASLRVRSLLGQTPLLLDALYARDDTGALVPWPLAVHSAAGVPLDMGRALADPRLVAVPKRGRYALPPIDLTGDRLWIALAAEGAYPHTSYGADAAIVRVVYADGPAGVEVKLQNGRDLQDPQVAYASFASDPESTALDWETQDRTPLHYSLHAVALDPRRRVARVEIEDLGVVSTLRLAAATLGVRAASAPPPSSGLILEDDLLQMRPEVRRELSGIPFSVHAAERVLRAGDEGPGAEVAIPVPLAGEQESQLVLRLPRARWAQALLAARDFAYGAAALLFAAALVLAGADVLRRARHLRVKMLLALGAATVVPLGFLFATLVTLMTENEESALRAATLADLRAVLERIERAPAQARSLAARARDTLEIAGAPGTPAHAHLLRRVRAEVEQAGAFLRLPHADATQPSPLGNAGFFDALARPGLYYSPWDGLVAVGIERGPAFRRYLVGIPSAALIGESPSPEVSIVLYGPDGEPVAGSGDVAEGEIAGGLREEAQRRRVALKRADEPLYEPRVPFAGAPEAAAHELLRERGRVIGMVGVYRSRAATERAKTAIHRTLFLTGLAAVLLVVIAGGTLADRVTERLRRVTLAARSLAQGDLSRRVPVEAEDEVGRLAASFNTMADALHTRVRQLTDLHAGLQALAGALDRRDVAAAAAGVLARATGAADVAVAAVDAPTGRTETLARKGSTPIVLPRIPDDGALRRAFDTQEPVFDAHGVVLPLVAGGRTVGLALCTGIDRAPAFDREFLGATARQVGIALENARLYQLAVTDESTGLYTHAFLVRRLREEVDRAAAAGRALSLLRIAVEDADSILGRHGADALARLLAEAGEALLEVVSRRNLVARRDAASMDALLVEADAESARATLDAAAATLERRDFRALEGERPRFTYGCVTYPRDGASARILLDALDRAGAARIAPEASGEMRLRVPEGVALAFDKSPTLRSVLDVVARVAPTKATVLLSGETGTGKEVLADLIHWNGDRRDRPFVKVNCAAIPETLLEAELFGHERGAFTGADRRRIGRFEEAHTGTLFLDEIGELPLAMQAKLLRVLQESRVTRVGGSEPVEIDVRIVAATNRDLEEALRRGAFREDLYYRLRVIEIRVPPLRERREEIPHLVDAFRREFNARHGLTIEAFSPEALDALYAHAWPGNVRELRNVLERAMLLARGRVVEHSHLALPRGDGATATVAVDPRITPRQERILTRARTTGGLANGDVVALEGISARTALRDLDALVRRGLLVRVGRRRGAIYRPK
jgi:DNA-binding NtrC family response regulator/HAMP domain-containing protein